MTDSPFQLAACAELLYPDLPIAERVRRIHDQGFAVEIWDWRRHDIDELAALAQAGVRFTSMTGYTEGDFVTPDGREALLRTAAESIEVGRRIGVEALNLHGTGLGPDGIPLLQYAEVTGEMWLTAVSTLQRVAELGEREGARFVLENLNTVDHPGCPFAMSGDTKALIAAVDSPHLRLNLDLYHVQMDEGRLIDRTRELLPWVGEIQVADVPGRCEPGTGEINYPAIARALHELGYAGVVGLEALASGDSDLALERFREAFTL